jgi:hypothetical protein
MMRATKKHVLVSQRVFEVVVSNKLLKLNLCERTDSRPLWPLVLSVPKFHFERSIPVSWLEGVSKSSNGVGQIKAYGGVPNLEHREHPNDSQTATRLERFITVSASAQAVYGT